MFHLCLRYYFGKKKEYIKREKKERKKKRKEKKITEERKGKKKGRKKIKRHKIGFSIYLEYFWVSGAKKKTIL